MILVVVLLLTVAELSAKVIILPDKRIFEIPEQDIYSYILEEESPASLERLYILSNNDPEAALLCPKGYSILEVRQELVVNESLNHLLPQSIKKVQTISLRNLEQNDDYNKAPCQTAYHCLSYQACIFKYDNDLCLRDPVPPLQEFLLLTIGCFRDDLFEISPKFKKNKDFVLHIYHSPFGKSQDQDFSMANLTHIELAEEDVFSKSCPSLEIAKEKGYVGSCLESPPPAEKISLKLWVILGKVRSQDCRNEIIQNYCAFQYNRYGLCIPPIYLNKNLKDGRLYNFQALPQHRSSLQLGRYMKFLSENNADLIPTRLAFIIMAHSNVESTVMLMNSIYRKNFLYVIHVDKAETFVREELDKYIQKSFYVGHNVVILPKERSFSTTDESYESVRARLESFEELLHLGIWDFAITLSEEDIPLRNVDDLAIILASNRGLSFLPDIQMINNVNKTFIISCDGQIHKIFSLPDIPRRKHHFQLYTSSQDGVLSRKFVEYLVNEKLRSDAINKQQFYLQAQSLSSNSYIPTILMNSQFRDSLHFASFHATRKISEGIITHETWPTTEEFQEREHFSYDDAAALAKLAHNSFFGHKFRSSSTKNEQKVALKLAEGEYYQLFEEKLPTSILKALVEDALVNISAKGRSPAEVLSVETVLNLIVGPSLVPHKESCRSKLISAYTKFMDFNYWLDVSIYNKRSGNQQTIRMMMQPSMGNRNCYESGVIRMISLSPWPLEESPEYSSKGSDFEGNYPFPYFSLSIKGVLLHVLVTHEVDAISSTTQGNKSIKLKIVLASLEQTERCSRSVDIFLPSNTHETFLEKEGIKQRKLLSKLHTVSIPCDKMEPGLWKLQVTQISPTSSKPYALEFYLLDQQNLNHQNAQLKDISSFWTLKNFCFITKNHSYNFQRDEFEQKSEAFQQKYLPRKPDVSEKMMHSESSKTQSQIIGTGKKREKIYTYICGGGLTGSFAAFLTMLILFYGWKYRFHQKLVFIFMLLFIITILQVILILTLCKE